MVKKLFLIVALAFTLAMASPVGEARAATNTADAIRVAEAQAIVQAEAVIASIEADLAMGRTVSLTGEQLAILARPSGFFGWVKCIASVAALVGGTGWVALRLTAWIKRAGSIKKAVNKTRVLMNKLPPAKRKALGFKILRDIGLEALGITAVYDNCLKS